MQHITKKQHIYIYTDCSDWELGGDTEHFKFWSSIKGLQRQDKNCERWPLGEKATPNPGASKITDNEDTAGKGKTTFQATIETLSCLIGTWHTFSREWTVIPLLSISICLAEGTVSHSQEVEDLSRWLPQFCSQKEKAAFLWGYHPFLLHRGTRQQEVGGSQQQASLGLKLNGFRNGFS